MEFASSYLSYRILRKKTEAVSRKNLFLWTLGFGLWAALSVPVLLFGETRSVTYLKNSEQELTIYFIDGKIPGNTMMIIGGIQGDEPGGYLAADLYADMLLEKGSLIVVPRANFYSIRKNQRGVNGDMNRKFDLNQKIDDADSRIIDILDNLIARSNVLLNLHEGSGFYNPEYISDIRNPDRFGQSIIADAATYTNPEGKKIDLLGPASQVIQEINENIPAADHKFHFNNHDTFSESSKHKEQRKSATFYALSKMGIPAFGIETAKDLPSIQMKVRYETLAINAFMKEFGIIPEHPSISLPTPELDHLVINVIGNSVPFAVNNGSTLSIKAGSTIHVMSVVANYQRGLSIDIVGIGNSNDLGRVAVINSPTTIKVYKDAFKCGEVHVETTAGNIPEKTPAAAVVQSTALKQLEISVSNKNMVVSNGDTLHIIRGDLIKITDAWGTDGRRGNFKVNFVGFVGNELVNDGEDRNYEIDTASSLLKRFSIDGNGDCYRIEATDRSRLAGTVYVKLEEPRVDYVIVEKEKGTIMAFPPGSTVNCQKDDTFRLLAVVSNVTVSPSLSAVSIAGKGQSRELSLPASLVMTENTFIRFLRNDMEIGSIAFRTEQ
jgi:hypothetical protein